MRKGCGEKVSSMLRGAVGRDRPFNGQGVGLSVVLVNWNTRDLLLRCVGHLQGLGLPPDSQIIVVDNGSEDGSPQALKAHFPDVELIENNRNLGFARANNQALKRSKGSLILLLNTDCFPLPGAIEALCEEMVKRPDTAVAGGALIHPDGRPQHSFHRAPTLVTELLNKSMLNWLWPSRFPSWRTPSNGVVEVEAVLGAFMMVLRKAWREIGGMDEGYFLFLEETDLCMRMRQRGWRVIHVPHAKAVHLQGQSASLDLKRARLEFYRSRYRFFELHRGRMAAGALRAGLLIRLFFDWLSSLLLALFRKGVKKRHEVYWYLFRWHLMGRPSGWGLEGKGSSSRP